MILFHNFLIVLFALIFIYPGFSLRGVTRVLIGKRMSKDELSTYFTLTSLVTIVAPLIAGLIAQVSYAIGFILIFALIAVLISIIIVIRSIAPLTEKHTTRTSSNVSVSGKYTHWSTIKEHVKLIKENRSELVLPLLLALNRFIFGTSFLYIPLYFTEVIKGSLLELGIMLSVDSIAITLVSFPSKFLSDKLGNVTTLAITRILGGITFASLFFVRSPAIFILINFVGRLIIAMDNVPEVSLISKMRTANLSMSLIDSVSTLLSISSPLIALFI
ncbi:MFS transporter [Sulfurisphaera ohwakuensis]|uniref:MFS transporter n=1 Tax=Sulfurisphaera ohwakuensis TaxID=69656 RepID=UPI0036F1B7EA